MILQSEAIPWSAGGVRTIPTAFLNVRGPNGGTLYVKRLQIVLPVTLTTGAGVSAAAGTWAKFIRLLRIGDAQGDFIVRTGAHIRMDFIAEQGFRYALDPAAIAASQTGATRTIIWMLDFHPRRALNSRDFGVSVARLQNAAGGAINMTMESEAGLAFTGGNPTAVSGNFTLFADVYEESGSNPKTRFERRFISLAATVDNTVDMGVGVLRQAYITNTTGDTTTGGTAPANITQIEAVNLGLQRIDIARIQQAEQWEADRLPSSTADPFVQATPTAILFQWPNFDGKIVEMPRINGSMLIRTIGNTTANLELVFETLTPRNVQGISADIAAGGASGGHTETADSRPFAGNPGLQTILPVQTTR